MSCKALAAALFGSVLLLVPLRAETVRKRSLVERFVRLAFPGAAVRGVDKSVWEKEFQGYSEPEFFRTDAWYFEVVGKPISDEEGVARSVTGELLESQRRLVRAKVISLKKMEPDGATVYAAVFDYTFLGIDHCGTCVFRGGVVLIHKQARNWQIESYYRDGPNSYVLSATFTGLASNGVPQLLVEESYGGSAWWCQILDVFDISQKSLQRVGEHQTSFSPGGMMSGERYEKKLDLEKTRATEGRNLVFRVTTYTIGEKELPTPVITEETVPLRNLKPGE